MNIGTAAKQSGVSPKAIRHYESIGLIPSVARAANDYRVYSEIVVHILRFIHRARGHRVTVDEVAHLLTLWAAGILYPFFGVLLSPIIAAAEMSLNSVSVVGDALRLRSVKLYVVRRSCA